MSNTIHLPINRKWFDMILSGEKKEEYRSITNHYVSRLCAEYERKFFDLQGIVPSAEYTKDGTDRINIKSGKTTVTLTNGYNPTSPRIVVELLGLEIKIPNPAWCPPETEGLWFALKLGEIIETHQVLAVR